MICDIDNKIGNNVIVNQTERKHMSLENVCSLLCFLAGAVFFVMALFGPWRYFFLMGVCVITGIMIYESPERTDTKKKRRDDR